jgi:flagellar FliL protein
VIVAEPAFAQAEDVENFGAFDDDEYIPRRGLSLPPIGPMIPALSAGGGGLLVGLMLGVGAALLVRWAFAPGPELPVEPEVVLVAQALDPITVNLRGDGNRTVRVAAVVDVQTVDPLRPEAWSAALQDSVITLASDYTAEELLGRPGRDRFRRELRHRVQLVLSQDVVSDLHLTEMVVQ